MTNYEQALSWLGATTDMDDEFIVAMYKVKVCLTCCIYVFVNEAKERKVLMWCSSSI